MVDLNDLRLFERVADLRSFSAASRELDVPRSSVSRGIQRLETALGVRLLQRTTREVTLTAAGSALFERSRALLCGFGDTLDYIGSLGGEPRGTLAISTGIGFGVNILSRQLPEFMRRYPAIAVTLDLSSRPADLVSERVDVAVRMGAMPDSQIVARKLGALRCYCCAAPDYLARRGTPATIAELDGHDTLDLPVRDGRRFSWTFERGGETVCHRHRPRVTVNCALTLHRMLVNGAGIGLSSGYLCAPEIAAGRLERLFPDWTLPPIPVHAVFPSQRQLSPAVRAFVEFMTEQSRAGCDWQDDPLRAGENAGSARSAAMDDAAA